MKQIKKTSSSQCREIKLSLISFPNKSNISEMLKSFFHLNSQIYIEAFKMTRQNKAPDTDAALINLELGGKKQITILLVKILQTSATLLQDKDLQIIKTN